MADIEKNTYPNAEQNRLLDFRKVCEKLFEPIHITDGDGNILFINDAYTRATGIFPEQVIGRNIDEVEGTLYRGSVSRKVIDTREQVDNIAHINGLNKDTLVTGLPIFDDKGNIEYVITNTRDIGWLQELKGRLDKKIEESEQKTNAELEYLRGRQSNEKNLIFHNPKMKAIVELIDSVSDKDITVLITGESGTGKEMICDRIYSTSNRNGKPFIKVNCAAIPSELLESELFGYEEGAFTDARKGGKPGLFELANNGIIFLDEIGDMPFNLQTKLLRTIQSREITRVGGTKPKKLDVRIIAASNRNLYQEVEKGNFRADLFYRLNVLPIEIPSLRERKEEIPLLINEFLSRFNNKYNRNVVIDKDALRALCEYNWPGNIRELENLLERFVVIATNGIVDYSMVASVINYGQSSERVEPGVTMKEKVSAFEKRIIEETLGQYPSIRKAAQALGINHATLLGKMEKYGITQE